jgi:hypothetical protein
MALPFIHRQPLPDKIASLCRAVENQPITSTPQLLPLVVLDAPGLCPSELDDHPNLADRISGYRPRWPSIKPYFPHDLESGHGDIPSRHVPPLAYHRIHVCLFTLSERTGIHLLSCPLLQRSSVATAFKY